ncbi:MAG: ankyrin repeat domain-containing protein, partial [Candidatus Thiodiazotropha endolucinida]|nr:ankyrin repeat domain-containing protein [Candidatus Thiodiazotropha endolucinida]
LVITTFVRTYIVTTEIQAFSFYPKLWDSSGYSSLMLAASNNHPAIIDLLIKVGADINQVEMTQGWTALIWAAKRGHREAVERLLRYPADREITDFNGKRALDWARQNQFHEIVSLLE